MNQEAFYPSLKKLSNLPEWRDFESFLDALMRQKIEAMLHGEEKDLQFNRACAIQIGEIKADVRRLIEEVEERKSNFAKRTKVI